MKVSLCTLATLLLLSACSGSSSVVAYPQPFARSSAHHDGESYWLYIGSGGYTSSASNISVYGLSSIPAAVISGAKTTLSAPFAITVAPSGTSAGTVWADNFGTHAWSYATAYSPNANGNVAPVYTLSGESTTLDWGRSLSMAIDSSGYLWTGTEANYLSYGFGVVATFPLNANGNESPIRYFESPKLIEPAGISFGPEGATYVTNGEMMGAAGLLVFPPGSSGTGVTPSHILTSPGTDWFAWGVAVDNEGTACRTITAGGWHDNKGEPSGPLWPAGYKGRINIWNECPPSGTKDPDDYISSSVLKEPRGITLDPDGDIWVADSAANAVFEFSASADKDSTPTATIPIGSPWGVGTSAAY